MRTEPLTIHQTPQALAGAALVQQIRARTRAVTAPPVRWPAWAETKHLLLMGATGSGKSALIKQLLQQIDARGDLAVVLDPACEYVRHFYRPERGDVIINPMDARCPYWAPGEELRRGWEQAEALTIAEALMPSTGGNAFFVDGPRRLFAFLIESNPDIYELVRRLTDGPLLDSFLKKELHSIVAPEAPEQRAGIRAVLAFVADTLSLLPTKSTAAGTWSATRWADHPEGWVFLTSTPPTRARCVPLHSVILDTLILRCMDGGPRTVPTWFVLDEVQTLNRLPQLSVALTEGRKWNMRVILGCQGTAQIDARYGHDEAKAILGQPATQIVLRTTEPEAAERASKVIGEQEIERVAETRRNHWGLSNDNTTHALQRHVERVVLASEIQGLPDRHAYLKLDNWVVPFQIAYPNLPEREPAFVARRHQPVPVPLTQINDDVCVVESLQ